MPSHRIVAFHLVATTSGRAETIAGESLAGVRYERNIALWDDPRMCKKCLKAPRPTIGSVYPIAVLGVP